LWETSFAVESRAGADGELVDFEAVDLCVNDGKRDRWCRRQDEHAQGSLLAKGERRKARSRSEFMSATVRDGVN